MIEKRKDGGPAFAHGNPEVGGDEGMSLRDYFAAAALTGILSNQDLLREMAANRTLASDQSYKFADNMIQARNKTHD